MIGDKVGGVTRKNVRSVRRRIRSELGGDERVEVTPHFAVIPSADRILQNHHVA
jgi:hypothetical protein